jgi:N-acetylglutamate synthase-like GNAT family acetyltransferase
MEQADFDEVISLLVSVFLDRPFYRYLAPDEKERRTFLITNFRQRISQGFGVNDIDLALTGQTIAGTAVWIPPARDKPLKTASPSPEEAFAEFSPALKERFFAFLHILHSAQEKAVQGPFWSLAPIAVLPQEQRKGIASALLRKKLKEIDAENIPCFLGTQDRINMVIYERFGFHKIREDPLIQTNIIHYTMLRGNPRINDQ